MNSNLIYLAHGTRHYGLRPLRATRRTAWEFQAVVKGSCGVSIPDERKSLLREKTLWIFPPGHLHGWTGDPTSSCEVAVFHFTQIPELLQEQIAKKDFLTLSLNLPALRFLKERSASLESDWLQPGKLSDLRIEQALLELTLLILENKEGSSTHPDPLKVERAIHWALDQLPRRPSLHSVAEAVHSSPAHLRRLFHRVKHASPQEVLREVRLKRAAGMMKHTNERLDQVAESCGFQSASDFSRAFYKSYGIRPSSYRQNRNPSLSKAL